MINWIFRGLDHYSVADLSCCLRLMAASQLFAVHARVLGNHLFVSCMQPSAALYTQGHTDTVETVDGVHHQHSQWLRSMTCQHSHISGLSGRPCKAVVLEHQLMLDVFTAANGSTQFTMATSAVTHL